MSEKVKIIRLQVIVEDLLTDNVYTFDLREELVRSSECDSWKEIPVRVDTAAVQQITADTAAEPQQTPGADRQTTDDEIHTPRNDNDVSGDVTGSAGDVTAAAGPGHDCQPQAQLLGD